MNVSLYVHCLFYLYFCPRILSPGVCRFSLVKLKTIFGHIIPQFAGFRLRSCWQCRMGWKIQLLLRGHEITRPLLTYSWSRVLLEKLTGSQLVKKFPAFYGTRTFITVFKRARQLSLFWPRSIQSISPSQFLKIHFNIIVLSTPVSSSWSLSLRFLHQKPISPLLSPIRVTRCHKKWNGIWCINVMFWRT